MERLLQAANEINAKQGVITDYQIENFADIVDAIHVVQTEMGITGTTAYEAGRTISGSVSAMKSAWANLVTGLADGNADVESLIEDLVGTIVGDGTENNLGVIGNVLPAIETALGGTAKLIEGIAPKIIEILPNLVTQIVPSLISAATSMVNSVIAVLPGLLNTVAEALVQNAPSLITAASGLAQSLIQGINDNYQILVDGAIQIVTQLANGILNMLPQIVELGLQLIISLANGIAESLPELIPTIVDVVLQIVDTLTNPETLVSLVDAALAIIVGLANGLVAAIPQLVAAIPVIIGNLVSAIIMAIPELMEAAISLITGGFGKGLASPEVLTSLLEGVAQMIGSIIKGILGYYKKIFEIGKEIFTNIKDGFMGFIKDPVQWGKDLIDNFIGGIKEKWDKLKNTVSDVAGSIKDFLGFSEPKKGPLSNFHTYAPDMMDLFAQGIKDNESVITNQIEKSFDFGERTIGFGAEYSGAVGQTVAAGTNFGGVTININGAKYSDEQSLAEAIAEALQNMTDRKAAVYA